MIYSFNASNSMIKYEPAPDIEQHVRDIIFKLGFPHDLSRIRCFRSFGSKSRRTIARCHTMPRIMQMTVGRDAHYAIEVLSEQFDSLPEEERIKTIIHEIMHIPKSMGGGFRHHDYVCHKNIEKHWKNYRNK